MKKFTIQFYRNLLIATTILSFIACILYAADGIHLFASGMAWRAIAKLADATFCGMVTTLGIIVVTAKVINIGKRKDDTELQSTGEGPIGS